MGFYSKESLMLLKLSVFSGLTVMFIGISSQAQSFDCAQVKDWPNYGGSKNGWAVQYCEGLQGNEVYKVESAFKDLEKYRNQVWKSNQGSASVNFENVLKSAPKINREEERQWKNSTRELHQKVSVLLEGNPQLCATSWECTAIVFGTTKEALMCGDSCNDSHKRFRFTNKLESLLEILGVTIQGMTTKSSSEEVLALQKEYAAIVTNQQHANVLRASDGAQVKNYLDNELRPAAVKLLEEYDAEFSRHIIVQP